MPSGSSDVLGASDALKTYRFLRIGMVGAVLLLAASILVERSKVDCWQTSISAYYYTPVRAIFVGGLFAVGLALIVIKGHTAREDACLNVAGMFAPLVAVAPTTDVGRCWSTPPRPLPLEVDGSLAPWVVTNVENNVSALLVAGIAGLVVGYGVAAVAKRGVFAPLTDVPVGTVASLVGAMALLVGVAAAQRWWVDFDTRVHGLAAVLMFVALIGAVVSRAFDHRDGRHPRYLAVYSVLASGMVAAAVVAAWRRPFGEHTVFGIEAIEIGFFACFWLVQTVEGWDDQVVADPGTQGRREAPLGFSRGDG